MEVKQTNENIAPAAACKGPTIARGGETQDWAIILQTDGFIWL